MNPFEALAEEGEGEDLDNVGDSVEDVSADDPVEGRDHVDAHVEDPVAPVEDPVEGSTHGDAPVEDTVAHVEDFFEAVEEGTGTVVDSGEERAEDASVAPRVIGETAEVGDQRANTQVRSGFKVRSEEGFALVAARDKPKRFRMMKGVPVLARRTSSILKGSEEVGGLEVVSLTVSNDS